MVNTEHPPFELFGVGRRFLMSSFAYTKGLNNFDMPEILVSGIPDHLIFDFLGGVAMDALESDDFSLGIETAVFSSDERPMVFHPIAQDQIGQLGACVGQSVTGCQLFYSDMSQRFPWQDGYDLGYQQFFSISIALQYPDSVPQLCEKLVADFKTELVDLWAQSGQSIYIELELKNSNACLVKCDEAKNLFFMHAKNEKGNVDFVESDIATLLDLDATFVEVLDLPCVYTGLKRDGKPIWRIQSVKE